jgi:hypothetical protein
MTKKNCIYIFPAVPKPIKIVYENSPPLKKKLTPEEVKELLLELFGTTEIGIFHLEEDNQK